MIDKKEIAQILDEIGTILEIQGDNPFKCRAYHNAARVVSSLTKDLASLIESDELKTIKGIGDALSEKIKELYKTGRLKYYEDLKKSIPKGLFDILRIQGLGPKRVKILYDKLKISTIDQLKIAAEEHKLSGLDGFGEKIEDKILEGIKSLYKNIDRHLYPKALDSANRIKSTLIKCKKVHNCEIAGSLRRRKEIIGDIDILVGSKPSDAKSIMDIFIKHPDVEKVTAKGDTKSTVILKSGINCDLRVVTDKEYPYALVYFTGSKEHNVEMRSLAKKFGLSLNEYGFSTLNGSENKKDKKLKITSKNESDIYQKLGLQYIPPELRENTGEIEFASRNALPLLINEKDIRGTFHCHTTYSDGMNSIEEMANAAKELGWEYIGIADHSKAAAYANGLSENDVIKQINEIEKLNKRFNNFRIITGTEVDILPDGSLDWNAKILERFDYVIASIHSKFSMTESEATRRTIKALKNKYVTMLGHPTGRLLLERDGYPINMNQVIDAASEYGKIIEINSHPQRLDLDWRMCKYAKEKSVKICINPDAHNIDGLYDVQYGVGVARKGWLSKTDVINTLPLKSIEKYLKLK